MNAEQLKKNLNSTVKIRPVAIRRDGVTKAILPAIDDDWMIQRVESGRVTLLNMRTRHVVELGNDSVREYRSSGHLRLACQVTLCGNGATIDPVWGP